MSLCQLTIPDLSPFARAREQILRDVVRSFLIPRRLLPKFRVAREVHAARARKLRRRGESVYFERWEHGHCVYSWGGPTPTTFGFRRMPGEGFKVVGADRAPAIIDYRPRLVVLFDDVESEARR